MWKFLAPFLLFVLMAGLLAVGLKLDPREIPSPLIDQPAPPLNLPRLDDPNQRFDRAELAGRPWLLNIWASWCLSCRAEHQVLLQLARQRRITLVGLDYKDEVGDALRWLYELGNPYDVVVADVEGRTSIDWGVYGVPETFLIDPQGIVRHKFTGPLTMERIEKELWPWLERWQ